MMWFSIAYLCTICSRAADGSSVNLMTLCGCELFT